MVWARHHPVAIAVALYVVLCLPPVKQALESGMTTQMLVQIPLLIVVGYLLAKTVPRRVVEVIEPWNRHGVAGLVLTTFAMMFWMLPRSLDAAVSEPLMAVAKFISVPLLVGLPLGLSWPRMGFVVRGVFLSEVISTCFRLGWLYHVSPVRLCNNYLLGDQQRMGRYMLIIGAAVLLWIIGKLLWGRFPTPQRD
jgi:hypothetical protein